MFLAFRKPFPTSRPFVCLICRVITNIYTKMESIDKHINQCGIVKPPEAVRGLLELDKKRFEKQVEIPCLSLKNVKVSTILPLVKKYLLKMENLKPIQHVGESEVNVFLNPAYIESWCSFPEEVQSGLQVLSIDESALIKKVCTLKYENFSAENIFRAVLPPDKEGMSSFTKVGHIVHINLREHLMPYKKIIGEILYDKVSGCRSVVNKTNIIDNTYRNFKMEVLKGDDDMLTTVKENNCTFKFDFSTVYWNSRLCTEHDRIIKKLKPDDVLFDVFAGVGPFSLPAAKKKCYVYANDLNPESFKWLNHNAKANKVSENYLKTFNEDGKDFIRNIIKKEMPDHLKRKQNVYITMNLPAMAVEFLHDFVGLFTDSDLPNLVTSPVVFVYCFAKGEDYESIARQLVVDSFGADLTNRITEVFRVRTVSSMKEMMRVTIKLDTELLVGDKSGSKRKLEDGSLQCNKKCNNGGDGKEQKKDQ